MLHFSSRLKIGFYGNANNYPFMLARALLRQGHQVECIVLSRERLNRPEFRYPDITSPYPAWIHDLSHPWRWRLLLPGRLRHRALAILNACDVVILNEEGPALTNRLTVPHIVLLGGSDLEIFAHPQLALSLKPQLFGHPDWLRRLSARLLPDRVLHRMLVRPQRAGIQSASVVIYFPPGLVPRGDQMLADLGVDGTRRLSGHMIDLDFAPFSLPPANSLPRIFCATRFTWKHEPGSGLTSLDYKGSDIMLHGLALFHRRTGLRLDINLVRKGRHVAETAALAESLGIADQITWHDEMSQLQIMDQFRRADIVFEQLAESIVGMAGLDAMASGRPLIANGRPEILETFLGVPSPICQAKNAEEVLRHLERLTTSAETRRRLGREGRAYVESCFSSDALARALLARLKRDSIVSNVSCLS